MTEEDILKITGTFHQWQVSTPLNLTGYENIPEFCYSASFDEVAKKDFSLVPSKYIEFVNRDENIDFDEKMRAIQKELGELFLAEEESKSELVKVFEQMGYSIHIGKN